MDMDPPSFLKLPEERDCISPLGLFDKFGLESLVHTSDDSDSDVQFVSELVPPHITRKSKKSTDRRVSQDLDKASLYTNLITTIKKVSVMSLCSILLFIAIIFISASYFCPILLALC